MSVEFDVKCTNISIHALREEGDCPVRVGDLRDIEISIHALREEGDVARCGDSVGNRRFLSTPSARRATSSECSRTTERRYFYPRPPRGGRPTVLRAVVPHDGISIHALREEGDWVGGRHRRRPRSFLSTPSARRATSSACRPADAGRHFYPRPPRGGRPGGMPNPRAVKEISIHALREEGDHRSLFRSAQKIDFYPRPPRGGRPTSSLPSWRGGNFYPRPPRGGRQAYKTDGWVGLAFLSTPSARRATSIAFIKLDMACYFYPRPPRGGRPAPQL